MREKIMNAREMTTIAEADKQCQEIEKQLKTINKILGSKIVIDYRTRGKNVDEMVKNKVEAVKFTLKRINDELNQLNQLDQLRKMTFNRLTPNQNDQLKKMGMNDLNKKQFLQLRKMKFSLLNPQQKRFLKKPQNLDLEKSIIEIRRAQAKLMKIYEIEKVTPSQTAASRHSIDISGITSLKVDTQDNLDKSKMELKNFTIEQLKSSVSALNQLPSAESKKKLGIVIDAIKLQDPNYVPPFNTTAVTKKLEALPKPSSRDNTVLKQAPPPVPYKSKELQEKHQAFIKNKSGERQKFFEHPKEPPKLVTPPMMTIPKDLKNRHK